MRIFFFAMLKRELIDVVQLGYTYTPEYILLVYVILRKQTSNDVCIIKLFDHRFCAKIYIITYNVEVEN